MDIFNAAPDPFSDDGQHAARDAMLCRVEQLIAEDVDTIDIGGKSGQPGAEPSSP